ncbi:MAG: response regulator [Nitrospina sp.]|nr:response regulator [Nitrospina sp.]
MESRLQILLVEDDEDDAFLIQDLMRELSIRPTPKIYHAPDGDAALTEITARHFDICIFDFRLGQQNGIDLLKEVRNLGCEAPIIFLTGQGDQETAVQAMKSGATDYLVKNDLSPETLFQSIRHATKLKKEEDLRKRAENDLRISHEELKHAHAELKQSLDKLQNAQDHIIRSEKLASVGRLAAGVCHEILNPLNIISGHIQALSLEREGDAPLQDDIRSIMEEIQRIEVIIAGLLKFSRKDEMVLKIGDINHEIESVLTLTAKEMAHQGITLNCRLSAELPEIKFDPNRMRQVFLNLVNNARHAMEKGGTLTVVTRMVKEVEEGGQHTMQPVDLDSGGEPGRNCFLQIRFQDTGPGIQKENIDKLFEPFFTTKPEEQGTGLGLSICYSIIEKHQGNLEVESEYGKGATFIIELPCNLSPGQSTPTSPGKQSGASS